MTSTGGAAARRSNPGALIAWQPGARLCDLHNHALVLKTAMAQAQAQEIGSALGQMRRKV